MTQITFHPQFSVRCKSLSKLALAWRNKTRKIKRNDDTNTCTIVFHFVTSVWFYAGVFVFAYAHLVRS